MGINSSGVPSVPVGNLQVFGFDAEESFMIFVELEGDQCGFPSSGLQFWPVQDFCSSFS